MRSIKERKSATQEFHPGDRGLCPILFTRVTVTYVPTQSAKKGRQGSRPIATKYDIEGDFLHLKQIPKALDQASLFDAMEVRMCCNCLFMKLILQVEAEPALTNFVPLDFSCFCHLFLEIFDLFLCPFCGFFSPTFIVSVVLCKVTSN